MLEARKKSLVKYVQNGDYINTLGINFLWAVEFIYISIKGDEREFGGGGRRLLLVFIYLFL